MQFMLHCEQLRKKKKENRAIIIADIERSRPRTDVQARG